MVIIPSSKAENTKNHFYNINTQLLSVLPLQKGSLKLKGVIKLESNTYSKEGQGQTTMIEFYGYPSSQYGKLEAAITAKTELSGDNNFFVSLEIEEKVLRKKNISFVYGMRGEAKILTEKKNIWQRILSDI